MKHAPAMFHRHIESRFNYTAKKKGLASANLELLTTATRLKSTPVKLILDDDEICNLADRLSRECGRSIAAGGLVAGRAYALAKGAKIPECTEAGEVARLSDARWWRRQLRVKHGRAVEAEALNLNIVNRKCEIYSSSASVKRRKSQKTRNRRILEEVIAVNELGQDYTLAELSELGVSNPAIRRGELMTRIAGFEQYAQKHGHVGVFWTITCPSRMHSALSKTGQRNGKYDGSTPKVSQAYLSKCWARVRAAFARRGINPYGMRVAEPQHDGTPHWHMLVFVAPEMVEKATEIYKHYALLDDGQEKGAQEHRFTSKLIDWKKGTAAGYIAKYIAKNIDAYGVDYDLYEKDAEKSVARVDAWASTWGIRQFQQVGGASVTVWRELRRMDAESTKGLLIDKHRAAADCGDWFAYLEQMKKNPVTLMKIWNGKQGRYVEPVGEQIIGVEMNGFEYITRVHQWEIKSIDETVNFMDAVTGKTEVISYKTLRERRVGSEKKKAIDNEKNDAAEVVECGRKNSEAAVFLGDLSPSWSSVNNCTRVDVFDYEKNYPDPAKQYVNHVVLWNIEQDRLRKTGKTKRKPKIFKSWVHLMGEYAKNNNNTLKNSGR